MNLKHILSIIIIIVELVLIGAGIYMYPAIFKTQAWGGAEDLPLRFPFEIAFNQPLIWQTIEPNIVISPSIKYTLKWSDDYRNLLIIPLEKLKENTVYNIVFKDGRSYSGTKLKNNTFVYKTEKQNSNEVYRFPISQDTTKKIDVDLKNQVLTLYRNDKQIAQYPCSTGKRTTPTKAGNFEVQTKLKTAYGCGDGQCWRMPFWLGFYNAGATENGIHELPFIRIGSGWYREGQNSLGYAVSHGCVRLGIDSAETVYNFAATGTPVIVHY